MKILSASAVLVSFLGGATASAAVTAKQEKVLYDQNQVIGVRKTTFWDKTDKNGKVTAMKRETHYDATKKRGKLVLGAKVWSKTDTGSFGPRGEITFTTSSNDAGGKSKMRTIQHRGAPGEQLIEQKSSMTSYGMKMTTNLTAKLAVTDIKGTATTMIDGKREKKVPSVAYVGAKLEYPSPLQ